MARLTETVFMERAPVVDRQSGTISNVKLLGWESRNKRKYLPKARESAARKYAGVKNYVNHDRESLERGMEDWASVTTEAHVESDGIYGTLKMRQKSPHYEPLMEAAEKFPKQFGMSHVAEGSTRMDDEWELVEDIEDVLSIDFVTTPATTKGLSESVAKQKAHLVERLQKGIGSLPDCPQRKQLTEMLDSYGFGEMPAEEAKPADPLSAFEAMCLKLIEMLGEALVQKNTAPPPAPPTDANAKPNANPNQEAEEQPEDEMSDEDKEKIAAFESQKREIAELKASNLLLESGRMATPARMKALANCETDDEREELLESWPTAGTTSRPTSSPPLSETEDFPRNNPEKFAAMLR